MNQPASPSPRPATPAPAVARAAGPQPQAGGSLADLPVTAQILVALKSKDPTALTAFEAISHLLGFEGRLLEIRRRFLHELVLGPGPMATAELAASLARYLDGTFVLWNPNKQRAWVRTESPGEESWEFAGGRRRAGEFGQPALGDPAYDHVLLWSRGQGNVPEDMAAALAPAQILAYGRGELYSLLWRPGSSPEERREWTASVALARSRREGLLVNPHYQDHRLFWGAIPLPLWGGF